MPYNVNFALIPGFGVLAQCNEQILMSGNAVHANHNTGVYIKQLLPVSIISNSITCNSGTGLHVSADAKVSSFGNEFLPLGITKKSLHMLMRS